MNQIIFHIDVNSAYLSWSALKKLGEGGPDLRAIPSIIGGSRENRHGIVLAKSIPAKAYHIYTSEPVVDALRKCPGLTIEPPDHALYQEYSDKLMDLLYTFTPSLEQTSIDECFMDFTSIAFSYPDPESAAGLIRDKIYETFGYTVNIGISANKLLAKMASDFEKPGRVHTLYPHELEEKLWPLPVERLYMCGQKSAAVLKKLEILTIGDLARFDRNVLRYHLKSHGELLWEYANGIDGSPVLSAPSDYKGIGNSITLRTDAVTEDDARHALLCLSENVSSRLREAGKLAGIVTVELKYSSFRSVSHQRKLAEATDISAVLYEVSCGLFDALWNGEPVRLLGIRCAKLSDADAPSQLSLFDYLDPKSLERTKKQRRLDRALDAIRQKYGADAVVRGSFMDSSEFRKH